jgi:ADP-ribose pyrophosphatase YjhB (NUDIX family)
MFMKFCPECGHLLGKIIIEERELPHCSKNSGGCGFIDFGRYALGVGGLVVEKNANGENCVLLVQRNQEPNKGGWTIPGGYVACDETAEVAVVREIEEETGLKCELVGLVGFRNRVNLDSNDTYAVFLLKKIAGDLIQTPTAEVAQVGFYTLSELQHMEKLAPLSKELAAAAIQDKFAIFYGRIVPSLGNRPAATLFMHTSEDSH